MKNIRIVLGIFLSLSVLVFISPVFGSERQIPLDHWSYKALDRLITRGIVKNLPLNDRPYTVNQVKEALDNIDQNQDSYDKYLIKNIRNYLDDNKLKNDIQTNFVTKNQYKRLGETDYLVMVDPGVSIGFGENLAGELDFRVSNDDYPDSSFGGKNERSYLAESKNGYMNFRKDWFNVTVGRFEQNLGSGRFGSLVLSPGSPSIDGIRFRLKNKLINYFVLYSWLPEIRNDDKVLFQRQFVVHKLTFHYKKFEISAGDMAIIAGKGNRFTFFSPFQAFYETANNRADYRDVNIMFHFDASVLIGERLKLYGEMLVDDFQVDEADQGESPNSSALLIGTDFYSGRNRIQAEYTWVDTWTYLNKDSLTVFTQNLEFRERIFGHPLGPDSYGLKINFTRNVFNELDLGLWLEYREKGENSLYTKWSQEADLTPEHPSGVVEKFSNIMIHASYQYKHKHQLQIYTGFYDYKNMDNIQDKNENGLSVFVRHITWLR